MRGQYADVDFENQTFNNNLNGKLAIMNAAKKYALCKDLKDCGAAHFENNEVGFGYLFESASEALLFAEYVYEIHYKWSHMTKNDYMGYPLVGLDQYYQMVSYNMKLVGSLSSGRALQYGEAANLYQTDFENRISDYHSLGSAALGTRSRNITYSSAFFDQFGKLKLDGETNIQAFDTTMGTMSGSNQFNAAETSALNAAKNSAIRRNKDIAKKKSFEKSLAKASAGTRSLYNKNVTLAKNFMSPNDLMAKARSGGGKGMRNLATALNAINSNIRSINKSLKPKNIDFGKFKPRRHTMSYRPSVSSAPSPNYGSAVKENDVYKMSSHQVDNLLNNLEKDKSLKPNSKDTLFSIVSKAYKRNYGRVLSRNLKAKEVPLVPAQTDKVDKSDKARLKKLLMEK